MGEWTTLSVKESTRDRFNQLKADSNEPGVPEMSADVFLNALMDTLEAVEEGHYGEPNDPLTLSEVDEIANQLVDQLKSNRNQDISGELHDIYTELDAIKSELRVITE